MTLNIDKDACLKKQKYYYKKGEYKKALEFSQKALKEIRKERLYEIECDTLIYQAGIYYRLSNYKKAEDKYYLALQLAKNYDLKKQECLIYNYFITLYEALYDYDKSSHYINKGFNLIKDVKDDYIKAKLLNSKGVYLHIFGNDEEALKNYTEAMEYYKLNDDEQGIGRTSNLIASHFYSLKQYNQSLRYFNDAKKIGEDLPDFEMVAFATCRKGLIYYNQSNKEKFSELIPELNILEEKNQNLKIRVEIYHLKALFYKLLDKFDKAKGYFEKALQLSKKIDLKYLCARIYKDMGEFYLEQSMLDKSYENFIACSKIFDLIKDKINNFKDRKKYEDSFQDILELIWNLSNLIDHSDKDEIGSKLEVIKKIVSNYRKISNNQSNDYAMSLQINLSISVAIKKINDLENEKNMLKKSNEELKEYRKGLIEENLRLRKQIDELKERIKNFEKDFEDIKKNPEKYNGLDETFLEDFINTEVWSDLKDQLINNYFSESFNILDEKSKNDLVFMKVIFKFMKTGYEICAFLLTKVVERELRRIIFKSFKNHWKSQLNECNFSVIINNEIFFNRKPYLKEKILKTNQIFLNYLKDKYPLMLGNISKIFNEIDLYCRFRAKKRLILGWEKHFLTAFKNKMCNSINKIYNGLNSKIHSNKDSIQFIDLRNLVSHADGIEPEIETYKEIDFDEDFIINLLEFLTIKNPRLLSEICSIKPQKFSNKV